MQYIIKEWPDHSASLIAEDGYELTKLNSLEEALRACVTGCQSLPVRIERHVNYLAASPSDYESSYI